MSNNMSNNKSDTSFKKIEAHVYIYICLVMDLK